MTKETGGTGITGPDEECCGLCRWSVRSGAEKAVWCECSGSGHCGHTREWWDWCSAYTVLEATTAEE